MWHDLESQVSDARLVDRSLFPSPRWKKKTFEARRRTSLKRLNRARMQA